MTSLRAVGRRGHLAREDWRGTEDVEDEEDTSPGRTGEGQRTSSEGQRTSLRAVGPKQDIQSSRGQKRTFPNAERTPGALCHGP